MRLYPDIGRMKLGNSTPFPLLSTDLQWKYLLEHDPQGEGGKKLKLEGKELMSVPRQLFALEGLQVLEMSPERKSCLRYSLDFIPHEIGHLRNLTLLYLDSNNLKDVPVEIGLLIKLERLTLSNNNLTFLTIPDAIHQLQKLETLLLLFNSLKHLPRGICSLKTLTTLWLGHNKLEELPSSFGQLVHLDWVFIFSPSHPKGDSGRITLHISGKHSMP
uniref:Uncharacterized protein n=1 Tax=Anolis carolinensis TaxID=28377 RepID=A0A803SQX9_ANOCA